MSECVLDMDWASTWAILVPVKPQTVPDLPSPDQALANSDSCNYAYSQLQQPSPKWRAVPQNRSAWSRCSGPVEMNAERPRKPCQSPRQLQLLPLPCFRRSKHVPALHKSHLGFLLLLCQSHWFSNQLRRLDVLVLDQKLGCLACESNCSLPW